jgi:hypothetical protein
VNQPNLPGLSTKETAAWTAPEQFTYNHVPLLRELLPQLHGVPGFYYLQCAVANRRRAESEGWQEVANTVTYTITGPKGNVDATLYCFGERVSGSDYRSSKRDCLVDLAIFETSGLTNSDAEPEAEPLIDKVNETEALTTEAETLEDAIADMDAKIKPAKPARVTAADLE